MTAPASPGPSGQSPITALPPGPYSYETNCRVNGDEGNGHVYILDRNGRKIASIWGKGKEKIALAKLIVEVSEEYAP